MDCADNDKPAKPRNLLRPLTLNLLLFHSLSHALIYTLDMSFAALGVDRWLVDSLHAMAIRKPTPIQSACIGPILAGSPSPCLSSIHPSLC